ncbi:hypothetical protein BDC45DRAFT_516571 [Circinella umbellata]|nr:hypothetical protein BDC45DRAFT_516571 [Circinella umbellata]
MKQITVDYEQDILELIIQFYGLLAKKDIRILCFGPYSFYQTTCKISSYKSTKDKGSEKEDFYIPIQKYNLPSWTGVNGEHNYWKIDKPSFENYTVNGRVLEITCRAFTNDEQRTESLTLQSIYDKIPPFPQNYTNNRYKGILTIRLTLQDSSKEKFIEIGLGWHDQHYDSNDYHEIIKNVWNFSHFLPMEKMDFRWTVYSGSEIFIPEFKFDKLTEKLQNSGQYAILTGVPFTHNSGIIQFSQYPVVKKEGDYYKAIGVCDIDNDEGHFFDGIELEEQTFRIH